MSVSQEVMGSPSESVSKSWRNKYVSYWLKMSVTEEVTGHRVRVSIGGELLPAEEEGGKNSSQYFIKYLSRLIMLKMYRKCTNAPFALFQMLEMLKHWLV